MRKESKTQRILTYITITLSIISIVVSVMQLRK